ncbi:MAG: hypothetical protein AB8B55_06095 [Mariniblastus sp.]
MNKPDPNQLSEFENNGNAPSDERLSSELIPPRLTSGESIPGESISVDPIPVEPPLAEPGIDQVYRYLMFGLSLPERTFRSTAAVVSGAVNESAELLVPRAFQNSKTYRTFVKQMLNMMANDVGGVKTETQIAPENESAPTSDDPNSTTADGEEGKVVENYVAKKTVSTFVDLAGMATLHVSPLTILAIVSDVAYGSKHYLHELAEELKREGVIAQDSTISNAADLLDAVGSATSDTADALDMPPVSVGGLRETIRQTSKSVSKIDPTLLIPLSEIDKIWNDMQVMAIKEDVNLFEISSAMTMYTLGQVNTVTKGALTTIRVTGDFVDQHLFDHYRQGLNQIGERGIYTMLVESSQPYMDAVYFNFSSTRPTITEEFFSGRMIVSAWAFIAGLFKRKPE